MIAPLLTVGSLIRRGRIFHPRGIYFRAEVEPAEDVPEELSELAEGLSKKDTLVRFSAGFWRMKRGLLPDVLGLSIRFNTSASAKFKPQENTQDLLMATSKSTLRLPLAALKTNQRNFLANIYHGMAKFELADKSNMLLRATPLTQIGKSGEDRYDALRQAVAEGEVVLLLETAPARDQSQWTPLVQIRLLEEETIDEREMSFWPFNTGQGIRPQGFVQFMRPVPYLSTQWVRLGRDD